MITSAERTQTECTHTRAIPFHKLTQIPGNKRRGQDDDIGRAEIEGLIDQSVAAARVLLTVLLYDVDDLRAHRLYRSKLAHIQAGQAFGQPGSLQAENAR